MPGFLFRHSCVILDASCTRNLYGSGRIADILAAIPVPVAIEEYVRSSEVLAVNSDPANGPQVREAVDLQPYVQSGLLHVVALAPGLEQETALAYAQKLGNGEAYTGAIAVQRNWAVAIDDRAAIAFFSREAKHLQLITTPELIKHWVDTIAPGAEVVRSVLQSVHARARYLPRRGHPLYGWWQAHT